MNVPANNVSKERLTAVTVVVSKWIEDKCAPVWRVQFTFLKWSLLFAFVVTFASFPTRAADNCSAPNFQLGQSLITGAEPLAVTVGDFNRDGKRDLAVANSGSDNLSIFLGDGHGKFSISASVGVGKDPRALAPGDINADRRGVHRDA
jgi:hypothetical protein